MTDEAPSKTNWMQITNLVITVVFPFLTMGVGWTANQVISNTTDLAAMKANVYTKEDAALDKDKVYSQILNVKDLLHKIDKKVPDEVPPPWFKAQVEVLRREIEYLKQENISLRNTLDKIRESK